MTGKISLTASMRSNLLSLQNISRQVSSTQNKLATGNKVNSAIDNPSSYYTARSLTNRANDLDALLDSMGQAVSTIKSATTALETGASFLEQAAAVASSALETNTIPAKSYFEGLVGDNGAVVSTAQELKDAVASGKETICVYGKIQLYEPINLQDNQNLVGTEYFTGYTGTERFSAVIGNDIHYVIAPGSNSLISDLNINSNWQKDNYAEMVISVSHKNNVTINNVSMVIDSADFAIQVVSSDDFKLTGNITIEEVGKVNYMIRLMNYANGDRKHAILDGNIYSNVNSCFFWLQGASGNLYGSDIELTIKTGSIMQNKSSSNNSLFYIGPSDGANPNNLIFEQGVLLAVGNNSLVSNQEISYKSTSTTKIDFIRFRDMSASKYFDQHTTTQLSFPKKQEDKSNLEYEGILSQYDSLIKDASYKGTNLLKEDKLNVRFNENGSSDLNVNGKDMSSASLGLNTVNWTNQGDIAQSLKEIADALKSIRAFTAELGNNYSIITSRQEFTENLINILTEGADKLTLADMNEESANMLALQTRQQLAVNALSLASQSAQSVLKLF